MRHTLVVVVVGCLLLGAELDAQQAQTPQAPVPRQPPVVSVQRLPSWLRVGLEHRGRLEAPVNSLFNSTRDDAYWLNRFRFDVRVKPSPMLSFQVQVQDAQVFGRNPKPDGPPYEDTLDLRMAFADVGQTGKSPVVLRLGRQELAFGEQRLVGHVSWTNTARTFDAARVTLARKAYRLDAFASSVVAMRDGDFNRSGQGEAFHGAYAVFTTLVPNTSIEPFALVRTVRALTSETGFLGELRSVTFGGRVVGKLSGRFDYNTEMALQRGALATDDVRAWAGHWVVGRTLVPPISMRVFGEYNYASGDEHAADGTRGTFDQLYPTPHDKYGLADQIGWRNIHHLRAGVEVKPAPRLALSGGYHSWWRASLTDNVYSAAGAVLVRSMPGLRESHIGQELDAQVTYSLNPRIQVHGGYAHIIPGAFLNAATPGERYSFPFVMVTSAILKGDR
jgi:Alginate export